MTKKTERKSKTGEPARTSRKLTLKKDTLKDLTAPSRGHRVKGGAFPTTDSCVNPSGIARKL